MKLHTLLDHEYGTDGAQKLKELLQQGEDVNGRWEVLNETPLHVAVRRRRLEASLILLDHGADIEAKNDGEKTAYAHAIRRDFDEIAEALAERGANTTLNEADQLAVAMGKGEYEQARKLLAENPGIARTGNPEEDRLLADLAGRFPTEPIKILIEAGADLSARALDDGTALHQAAWFGQPQNARLLIAAGAPLDVFEETHQASPLHWAIHGSRYSGGAEERQEVYVELVEMLLEAGSSLQYPDDAEGKAYWERMLRDASEAVREVLVEYRKSD